MRLGYAAMARFIVEGGAPLRGEITAKGNKNSALPLIAASLLTSEPLILRNLPRIRDVNGMLEIVSTLGASVEWLDEHSVKICAANVNKTAIDPKLSKEIRTSLLFAGPMLARFKKVTLGPPGGDVRPGAGPRLRPVRRHDAADRQLLHLLELRQQHRLRLI
jgi:UDP-N-acetylglucosamine 1-carboxyvinyltransferase